MTTSPKKIERSIPKTLVVKITVLNANFGTLVAIPLWAYEAGLEPGSPMGDILAEANLVLGWKPNVPIVLPMGHKGIPIQELIASIRRRRFTKPAHRAGLETTVGQQPPIATRQTITPRRNTSNLLAAPQVRMACTAKTEVTK